MWSTVPFHKVVSKVLYRALLAMKVPYKVYNNRRGIFLFQLVRIIQERIILVLGVLEGSALSILYRKNDHTWDFECGGKMMMQVPCFIAPKGV